MTNPVTDPNTTPPANDSKPTEPPAPVVDESGFPANTPVAEMTDKQAAEYWKHQARKHEGRVKSMGDYDTLKANSEQYAKLVEASKTEQEKAIDSAKAEARTATLREVGSRLVDAQITAVSAGRMSDGMRTALLDGLDRSRFLTADGDVDADKVKAFVDGIAPAGAGTTKPVDLGQGKRGGNAAPSLADGSSLYAERHGKKN